MFLSWLMKGEVMHSQRQTTRNADARIEHRGQGVGPPTTEMLEERAREIARIDGRPPDQVTKEDRLRASQELHGETLDLAAEIERSDLVASGNPANLAVETGYEALTVRPADEQQAAERAVKEGRREAEHERMIQGQEEDARDLGRG
jgi:hypothetical protein